MPNDLLVGRKAIAHELGMSEKTVSRRLRANRLAGVWQDGGPTSPLKARLKDLRQLQKRGRRKLTVD